MTYIFVILTLTVIVTERSVVNGIKCYTCNSKQDPRCSEPLKHSDLKPIECFLDDEKIMKLSNAINQATLLRERKNPSTSGLKPIMLTNTIPQICQKIEFKDDRNNVVIGRGCTTDQLDWYDSCESLDLLYKENNKKLDHCSTCKSDFCNASSKLSIQSLLLYSLFFCMYTFF